MSELGNFDNNTMSSNLGQISEPSTADLRRELRRKRILETAKSRLEKLNGKAQGLGADPIGICILLLP